MSSENGKLIDLTKCELTWEEADKLVGKQSVQGKIIGISGSAGRTYQEGIYLTTVTPNERAQYHKVGELQKKEEK